MDKQRKDILKKEILDILDQNFAFEDTDWIPAFALKLQLRERKLNPSMSEIVGTLQNLDSKGSVEFSPTIFRNANANTNANKMEGFIVRITTEGHNRMHYGRPSLLLNRA